MRRSGRPCVDRCGFGGIDNSPPLKPFPLVDGVYMRQVRLVLQVAAQWAPERKDDQCEEDEEAEISEIRREYSPR